MHKNKAYHIATPSLASPLSQSVVDGCMLIGIAELAQRLHRAEATIRTQVTREPEKLPPRFLIPSSSQVVWMLSTVIEWMVKQQSSAFPTPATEPLKSSIKPSAKRRGAPTGLEKLAARNLGMSVSAYRAAQTSEGAQ